MRNLMALLMTCASGDVSRIAGWWSIDLPQASRAERAATLGREMVRDASGRRFWEALDEDSRNLFFRFGSDPEQRLSETGLKRDSAPLRTCMDAGALWAFEESEREGGLPSLSLPPAPDPTLVLPPELCRLANRLLAEIEQGDVSQVPLDEALRRLGTGELENLAAYWGLAAEPGSYTRDELVESLLGRISGAPTERVVAEAPETARKLYEALVNAGGRVGTARLGAGLGVSSPALRDAVADLGDRLLALETFDGEWQLFTPEGPEHTPHGRGVALKPPESVASPGGYVSPPNWAGAWDLLNLLRSFELYEVPVAGDGGLPGAFVSRFDTALATRPSDPATNLAFLHAVARSLELSAVSGGSEKPAPRARQWAESSLETQARRLLAHWTEHGLPAEAAPLAGAAGFRHDPATMQMARRRLLEHLAACEPGRWYPMAAFVESIHDQNPHLLRPQNRLVRDLGSAGARRALENWRQLEGGWIETAMSMPLAWLHVVEVIDQPEPVFTLTTDGAWLTGRVPRPPIPSTPPRISVSEEGRVRVSSPDSRMLWTLGGFARPVRSGGRPGYLIDRRSVARARSTGLGPQAVVHFLRTHAEGSVPQTLAARIQEWGRDPHRIEMQPALLVRCETEAGLEELMASPIVRSYKPRRIGIECVLLTLPEGVTGDDAQNLLRRLTHSGLFSAEKLAR